MVIAYQAAKIAKSVNLRQTELGSERTPDVLSGNTDTISTVT